MKVERLGVVALAVIGTVSVDTAQRSVLLPPKPALVQKLLPSDGVANDEFGLSVDLWGDTAVVGAWQLPRTGEAYVYERHFGGKDAWGEVKILRAQNAQVYEWFGNDVAIQRDRIVVGAPERNVTGTAIVFERDAGGPDNWGEVVELVPAGFADRFGMAVALDGDRIAVGAPFSKTVHIFERDAGGPGAWGEVAVLQRPTMFASSVFGNDVELEGDRIAVGDPEFGGGGTLPGSAYVFERDPDEGVWALVKTLKPPPGRVLFGLAVALAGNVLAVGGDPTRVYIYDRNQGGNGAWGEIKRLVRPYPFSVAVAFYGERLAVGTFCPNPFPLPDICSVFVFERHLGGENAFGELFHVTVPSADEGNSFGFAVALFASHVLVGAYQDDELAMDAGAAYIYRFSASGNLNPAGKQVR